MSENHRGPEVPEVRVPAVECRDGLARITLEELAITHFVSLLPFFPLFPLPHLPSSPLRPLP